MAQLQKEAPGRDPYIVEEAELRHSDTREEGWLGAGVQGQQKADSWAATVRPAGIEVVGAVFADDAKWTSRSVKGLMVAVRRTWCCMGGVVTGEQLDVMSDGSVWNAGTEQACGSLGWVIRSDDQGGGWMLQVNENGALVNWVSDIDTGEAAAAANEAHPEGDELMVKVTEAWQEQGGVEMVQTGCVSSGREWTFHFLPLCVCGGGRKQRKKRAGGEGGGARRIFPEEQNGE